MVSEKQEKFAFKKQKNLKKNNDFNVKKHNSYASCHVSYSETYISELIN